MIPNLNACLSAKNRLFLAQFTQADAARMLNDAIDKLRIEDGVNEALEQEVNREMLGLGAFMPHFDNCE